MNYEKIFLEYGLDYKTTMARFVQNEELYLRLLNMLLNEDDSFENLGKALAENNLTKAFEAAHTLKGVAENMGIMPILKSLKEIVEPLRNRFESDDYLDKYAVLSKEFETLTLLRNDLTEDKI